MINRYNTLKHILFFLAGVGTMILVSNCSEVIIDNLDPNEFNSNVTTPSDVSFSAEVLPLLTAQCGICHGNSPTPPATLSVTATDAHQQVIDLIADPTNPDTSVFMFYASGQVAGHVTGTYPTSSTEYAIIRQWIIEGALNN